MKVKIKSDIVRFFLIFAFCLVIYFLPLLKGKILLPLDLLVNDKFPWNFSHAFAVKNPYLLDIIVFIYPGKSFAFESLRKGILPLWSAYSAAGAPFLASMQAAVFYPLSLLAFLGNTLGWNLYLVSQILLSGFFSFLLAREFKLRFWPSILVAISFSFQSFLICFLLFAQAGHVISWFPLFLFFAKKIFKQISLFNGFLFCMAIAFSALAGHFQFFVYGFGLVIVFIFYYYFNIKRVSLKKLFLIFLLVFLGLSLASIQTFPTYEALKYSPRLEFDIRELFSHDLLVVPHLIRFLAPDYFGSPVTRNTWGNAAYIEHAAYFGVVPLFFCLYAIFSLRKSKIANFFKIVFILSILLAMRGVGEIIYWLKLPLLSSSPGHRILSLTGLAGAILAGFGLQNFLRAKKKKQLVSIVFYSFLLFSLFCATLFLKLKSFGQQRQNFTTGLRNLLFPIGIWCLFGLVFFFTALFKKNKNAFLILVVAITFLDLYRLGHKFLPFSETKYLYPKTKSIDFLKSKAKSLDRFYGPIEGEIHAKLNLYSVETYNPLYVARYGQLINYILNRNIEPTFRHQVRVDHQNKNAKRIFDLLGVKYLWHRKDYDNTDFVFPHRDFKESFKKVYDGDKTVIYENLDVLPRFGLFYQYLAIPNEGQILKLLASKDFDFQNKLILEKDIGQNFKPGKGRVKLIENSHNFLSFAVETDKKALFFLSDNYYPGWEARVNNQKTEILRANYSFRGVLAPAGKSRIDFIYRPQSVIWGARISLLSLVVLVIVLCIYKRYF